MPADSSFDIVSQVDLQEMDNAVNQVVKEMNTRFDFKGSKSEIRFDRNEKKILLLADDDMKHESIIEMLKSKMVKRGIAIKAIRRGTPEKALDGMIREKIEIIQGIAQEQSKQVVKYIKELKLKVQPSIQGEEIRVSSRSKDDLQAVIQALRSTPPVDIPLQFVNYR